jgi:hypothetical protein
MLHALLADASFWQFLLQLDEDLAAEVRAAGCPRLAAPMSPSGFMAWPKGARRPSPAIRSDFSDRGSTADCGPFATHSN